VGLIPFVKNDLTAGIYPLKINEYLALGLPVVSTHFADLSDFQGVCTVADDTNTFLAAIAQALLPQPDGEQERRRRFAEQNTWAARAAALDEALRECSMRANNSFSSSPKA
jgi:glycosyltransferase involved in cell wall biosynthesis